MASPLPSPLVDTLAYFAKYNYPLTDEELWFWQHGTQISKAEIAKSCKLKAVSSLRKQRKLFSEQKWLIAKRVGERLQKILFIEAIFVTGALAMNNCPADDDIDMMIITAPHTLWLTRILTLYSLGSLRRRSGLPHTHPLASNKICDNLYLDLNHLSIPYKLKADSYQLYMAHEILQAKCLFDRGGIHCLFLEFNSWAKSYLPVAYRESLRPLRFSPKSYKLKAINYLLWPLNLLAFVLQFAYMKPKMTSEKVGLGFAFFHPHTKTSQFEKHFRS
ncbi:hypothetical protein A3D85_02195 [Candidatus Amesbacteria bacterium RIFCSPHIGHO2_02_FULL_47_9]|uniref:Polymerase nucleotidyl transferase domain-containing protein n=1 Tax=Candidatus Amesbacteria bacterium RIFCSPHIGHO2_01_FULL_48_32b TaxID=1797253 RepID=A0A1F4YGK3_9BACT|nr:MAG: hypothetical protein A2876_01000 [Candidatus Amesbacteria bacterium RIFCSPHIGHO2_01_FULL_48_32b]OGD05029.1 MAG: hypothetical protein A3D85_02195 [Candidatus Amesbacteria bacterium RIFCSPHIGHO2_02_FULL_47_9]OGD07406.1 MAG: hypothetical protein A2899_03830 [Candidatus Amesbacteria bacterium RIFCSPLOWO2_01_FULL_49_25]